MKAILVIDTDNCWDCPLERDGKCQYSHRKIAKNNIPSWCPLKPLPEKIESGIIEDGTKTNISILVEHFAMGWNACLEALEDSHNGENSNDESNTCVEVISNEKNAV